MIKSKRIATYILSTLLFLMLSIGLFGCKDDSDLMEIECSVFISNQDNIDLSGHPCDENTKSFFNSKRLCILGKDCCGEKIEINGEGVCKYLYLYIQIYDPVARRDQVNYFTPILLEPYRVEGYRATVAYMGTSNFEQDHYASDSFEELEISPAAKIDKTGLYHVQVGISVRENNYVNYMANLYLTVK